MKGAWLQGMVVCLNITGNENKDALKLVTNLKEKVKDALCVARETKDKLLAANQEAEPKGKALKAIIRQLWSIDRVFKSY